MKTEPIDNQMAELIEQVRRPLRTEAKARSLSGMAASRPARAHPRRRLIAIAVGAAAVVLFGLGFVPFPAGSAKGALTKALAAFDQLITKHTIEQSWDAQGNEYLTETWFASDGFLRQDEFKGDSLSHVWIMDGTKMLYFHVADDGQLQAKEDFLPNAAHDQQQPVKMHMFGQSSDAVGGIFNMLKKVDAYKYVTINEYQERSLWGGAINIAEVETDHGAPGHGQKWRFEIDPTTDRVMKTVFYVSSGTAEIWKEKSETHYEWDAPIPESAHDFTLPAGTKLTRNLWWQDKVDKVIAQASTADGEVILHDVEVDNKGNILASISTHNISVFPQITVEDNLGNGYSNGGSMSYVASSKLGAYMVLPITKAAGDSAEIPTTATFTFRPPQEEASEDQVAVLKDIPLPAPQPLSTQDILHKDDEVVQY